MVWLFAMFTFYKPKGGDMNGISKKAHVGAIGMTTIASLAQGNTSQIRIIAIVCVAVVTILVISWQALLDRIDRKGKKQNGKEKSKTQIQSQKADREKL